MSLWGYKVLAGVVFYMIFSLYKPYSHGSDSDLYFKDGVTLANVAKDNPSAYFQLLTGCYSDDSNFEKFTSKFEYWNRPFPSVVPNDNRIVIRLNSLISFVSFNFYTVHLLFIAFLSFIGLLLIYNTIASLLSNVKRMLVFAVFIIPSTVFWSAGDLKEPILILLFGLFLHALIKSTSKSGLKFIPLLIITLFFMIFTKPYILFLLIPTAISFLIVERFKVKRGVFIYFAVFALFGGLIALISIKYPELSIANLLAGKQLNFISMLSVSSSGSNFDIPILDGTYNSILFNAPLAFINSLSRPLIWEPESWPQFLAALENIVVIAIAILLLIRFRFSKVEHANIALFSFVFCVQLFILAGLITPNMGALVRYKSIGLPFLFIALLSGWSLVNTNGKELFTQDVFKYWRLKIRNYFWVE
jgi:hypothetical protein